jgi:hypothetical protein
MDSLFRPRLFQAVCIFVWLSLFVWTPSAAERIEINTSLDFCSDYVWRGLVINDEPVFQPSFTATQTIGRLGSFSFNIWGNLDFTDYYGTNNKFSEIDLTASYTLPSGPLGLEVGFIHYSFPSTDARATTEVYILAGFAPADIPLAFFIGAFYDFDEIDGFYLSGKITSLIPLTPQLSLELALSAGYANSGYNQGYFNVSESSLVDSLASAALIYKVSDLFSLSAYGQYMSLLDSTLKETAPINNRDKLTGCLSLKFDF